MNLFFDTETTGLPDRHAHWQSDFINYPYIVSAAWEFKGKEHYYIVHQEGRKMPKEAEAIHGISTEQSNDPRVAVPFDEVFLLLLKDANKAVNIIGHSLYFDLSIFKANVLRRYGVQSKEAANIIAAFDKDKRIDTMRGTQRYFGKWPKLNDLHVMLFNKNISGAHNALVDAIACKKCYEELRKRKMI